MSSEAQSTLLDPRLCVYRQEECGEGSDGGHGGDEATEETPDALLPQHAAHGVEDTLAANENGRVQMSRCGAWVQGQRRFS